MEEEERLGFVQRLVQMIEMQTYGQLMFILFVGLSVVSFVLILTFYITRKLPDPHREGQNER